MNRFISRAAISLLLSLAAVAAFAQHYPMPGSSSGPQVLCTGTTPSGTLKCPGNNPSGQPNNGLPTYPFSSPIKAHVGRYVDSVNTSDWPGPFRTARAAKIVVAPTQRGSAPPRIYMQIGSAVAAYSIDTFFNSRLPAGLTTIDDAFGVPQHPQENEKALKVDAYVYPEYGSTWAVEHLHGQDVLFDIDYDDRGYVYAAYSLMGWGIVKDDGRTTGGQFQLVKQVLQNPMTAQGLTAIKAGAEYYVLLYDPQAAGKVAIYNVTNPTTIGSPLVIDRRNQAIRTAAKSVTGDRLAIVDLDNKIQIYDPQSYVTSGQPFATFSPSPGKVFLAVAPDADGSFWATEDQPPGGSLTTNLLWKFTPSGGTYTASSFNVYGEPFAPQGIHVRDGYIAIYGKEQAPNNQVYDARLYKITDGAPTLVDLKEFFRNYYHRSPQNYAMPEGYTQTVRGMAPIKYNNKLYLLYADHGLGDVYELQAGDSITASYSPTFGTPNPNSKATQAGPFHGDPITFTATASTPGFPQNVTWDFGNTEAGTANTVPSRTGDPVTYQYRSLSTLAQITTPRIAKVQIANDSSTNDSVTIVQKAPTPRVVVVPPSGPSTVLTNGAFVLPEDKFGDGSDGSVESHFSTYLISNSDGSNAATTNLTPSGTVAVGALGSRKLTFTATYGPYDGNLAPLASPSYTTQIANVAYEVRPFVVSAIAAAASGNSVTYSATARTTTDATVILPTATTWTVTWSLKNGNNVVHTSGPLSPTIGAIPSYVINDKSVITNGSKVELVVTIPPTSLGPTAQAFGSATILQDQVKPSTAISVVTGCQNTGQPCKLTAVEHPGATYSWSLTGPVSQSATGLTFEPSLTQPGSYSVTVTITSGVFTETSSPFPLTVQGPVCGVLPSQSQMAVAVFGLQSGCRGLASTPCTVGETVEFFAQGWGYTVQDCDSFSWNFGDGGTATGQRVQHAFPGSGPYTVSFTISNSTSATGVTFSTTISFGGGGPGNCPAPNGAAITVQGSQGCNGTAVAPCKTGENVTFYAGRAFGTALQACDLVSWSFSDGVGSSQSVFTRTFNTAGTVTVNLTINNTSGQAATSLSLQIESGSNGSGCNIPGAIDFTYQGQSSGCSSTSFLQCQRSEPIQFTATGFGYTYQSCDQFEWNFGDGGTSTERNPVHTFNGAAQGYEVSLRVYNTSGEKKAFRQIRLGGTPAKPAPVVTVSSSTDKSGKNVAVTFTAKSDIDATGWTWNFSDGQTDSSQASVVGKEISIQHVFTTAGTYTVSCSARNAEETLPSPPLGTGTKEIEVTNTPEHRFLLPVVTRSAGFGGSTWRTDVQVFNRNPNVSASNPLVLKMTFNGRNTTKSYDLSIVTSTFISEDFIKYFVDGDESGSVSISVMSDYQPQIWTRTYNLAANGTYGQFIPAILLSTDGTAATALPTVETHQYLAGVRSGSKYRTNVGLVNPMDRELTITINAYSSTYSLLGSTQKRVAPFQLVQFTADIEFPDVPKDDKPYTIKITVPPNAWLIAYASMVDQVSGDPTYVAAVSENDGANPDFKDLIVPGVGHTGPWRSDVTIFNPDYESTTVDLAYFNQEGVLTGEAKNIVIGNRSFLQLDDLLRAGYLAPQPADGIGALLIKSTSAQTVRFPIAYSRTYNFNGVSSFGQGIPAFSSARANVKPNKPAYIPAVRNENSYYTNIGLVNLTNAAVKVKVTLLRSDTGAEAESLTYDLRPFQSTVGNILSALGNASRGSLKVSLEGSTGTVWAFASVIDRRTGDPEYLAGIPTP